MKNNINGTSLIEILLATAIVVGVVASLSVLFPKATRTVALNHQTMMANQLAQNMMMQIKKSPYGLIDVTPQATFVASPLVCDCAAENLTTLPVQIPVPPVTVSLSGAVFTEKACVNYMTATFTSVCPNGIVVDPGLKKIHVRVSWKQGNTAFYKEIEGVSTN